MANTAKNTLSLDHEEAMNFFMKSEQYHGFELPKYFAFDEVLKFVRVTIGEAPYKEYASSKNVGCSHYALRVISRIIDTLKDLDEKRSIIDLVYHKLCNQPNSSYNQLWLQNMTYTQDKKQDTSHTPFDFVSSL